MPRGDGTGPRGFGPGSGRGQGKRGGIGLNSPLQKTTLGGTLFAFASMLFGNWLDKKIAQKKSKGQFEQNESSQKKTNKTSS